MLRHLPRGVSFGERQRQTSLGPVISSDTSVSRSRRIVEWKPNLSQAALQRFVVLLSVKIKAQPRRIVRLLVVQCDRPPNSDCEAEQRRPVVSVSMSIRDANVQMSALRE